MFGRVRMYNLGFAVYTVASLLLAITWLSGSSGATYLVVMRVFQGVGSAFLVANSAAILTDAFPSHQRGLALGMNNVAAISGSFLGLVLGGILGPIEWRLIFLVSVPFGLAGTLWAYFRLVELGVRKPARVDWTGNITFAGGLVLLMVGITYGIQPYGGQSMGWTSPGVKAALAGGATLLIGFAIAEMRVREPMFRLHLFRLRAFAAGVLSSFLSAVARGGMMFMLIIWLQGIWLPEHGYSFESTPLWAGIYMLPLTAGFLLAGPISGMLSDRYGARPFATGGMLTAAVSFALIEVLPLDFQYWQLALILLMNGLAMGAFAAPNRAGVMNSLPPQHRGSGGGMQATFQSSAQVLSIGIFFTLVILGLSATLPQTLQHGLTVEGVPPAAAARVAQLPPVEILFAAFLGYNPMAHLLPPDVLSALPHSAVVSLTSQGFFARLITSPFQAGLHVAFDASIALCLAAAVASWSRGRRYIHGVPAAAAALEAPPIEALEPPG
jgi:MFS family permease